MLLPPVLPAYSAHSTASPRIGPTPNPSNRPVNDEPPRKPDWLLVMMVVLFLLTLLIVWLVDIPVFNR